MGELQERTAPPTDEPLFGPEEKYIPNIALRAASALFLVSFLMPFAIGARPWFVESRPIYWNWSRLDFWHFARHPWVMMWFWLSSVLILAMAIMSSAATLFDANRRALVAWGCFLAYMLLRFPLDLAPSPRSSVIASFRVLLGVAGATLPAALWVLRAQKERAALARKVRAEARPAVAVASSTPGEIPAVPPARREIWSLWIAAALVAAFAVPFLLNWFWPERPIFYWREWSFLFESAQLVAFAALWAVLFVAMKRSYPLAFVAAVLYVTLYLTRDLAMLVMSRHYGYQVPRFVIVFRVATMAFGHLYPLLRYHLDRPRVLELPHRTYLPFHAISSAAATWVVACGLIGRIRLHGGGAVPLERAAKGAVLPALLATVMAPMMYLLLYALQNELARKGRLSQSLATVFRYLAIGFSTLAVPALITLFHGVY